jgi:hypothetical protein
MATPQKQRDKYKAAVRVKSLSQALYGGRKVKTMAQALKIILEEAEAAHANTK